MALGKRLINTGAATSACSTDSVQAFGADAAFSSNIALYQLDGDGGVTNNVPDTTTNYDGTASNVTYATGQFGNAGVFNGNNSYVSISATNTTPLDLSQENYSISAWVKFDTFSGDRAIISKWGGSASLRSILWWVSNGSIKFIEGGSADSIHQSTATLSSTGTWYHLVYIRSASESKIFINGSLDSTFARTQTIRQGGTEPYYLGSQSAGGFKNLDGDLDQVRIFNKAISAEDVATLYAETTSTASDTNPLSDGSGVALYSMDYDASDAGGYYDGTPTNVDFGVEGKINYGARFNGSSSKIVVSKNVFTNTNVFSLSLWFKSESTITTTDFLMDTTGGANSGFQMYINNSKLRFWNRSGSTTSTILTSTTSVDDGSWHNVVITQNSSGFATMYIDGQVEVASTNLVTVLPSHNLDLHIGGYYTNTLALDGSIDQVRIFSKALSSDEVDTLFAETACVYTSTTDIVNYPTGTTPVAYYKMDNSSEDYSTGGNDGTDTNVEYRFGRFGQAAVFNGSSSKIFLTSTGTSVTDYDSDFSVSMWVYMKNLPHATSQDHLWTGGGTRIIPMSIKTDGKVLIDFFSGSSNSLTSTTALTLNGWTHLVMTRSKTNGVKFYLDGGESGTSTYTGNASSLSQRDTIGSYWDGTRMSFDGKIDQVRIYDAALTSSQVAELYNEKPEVDTSNFKTVLYNGTSSKQYISNVGMDLETSGGLVWIKNRDQADNHTLVDSVRGISTSGTKYIASSATDAEDTSTNLPVSLEKNGFFVQGVAGITNTSGENYISWVFKGGGEAVNIGVNSITGSTPSIASDVSANTAAGFSIVKYTGNNTAGATVAHGLDYPPEVIIIKNLDNTVAARNWAVYHSGVDANPENYFLRLNSTINKLDFPIWNDTAPDSDVFTLGNTSQVGEANDNNNEHIAYCFHSVAGYSKIGSYEGNGTTATTTITTGFKPSWVMIKRTDAANSWVMFDNKRDTTSPLSKILYADLADNEAEGGTTTSITISSTGFSMSTSQFGGSINTDGGQYIYMAFK